MQIAESMILSGTYNRVLVTTGEVCSRATCWNVSGFNEFRQSFPGYTMGDAGAAALLERSPDNRGIFFRKFLTVSRHWNLATIPGGGSIHPRGDEHTFQTLAALSAQDDPGFTLILVDNASTDSGLRLETGWPMELVARVEAVLRAPAP